MKPMHGASRDERRRAAFAYVRSFGAPLRRHVDSLIVKLTGVSKTTILKLLEDCGEAFSALWEIADMVKVLEDWEAREGVRMAIADTIR